MKKILTVVFSVELLVLAMSTMAFADGNVAKIGETQYATLQDAVDAAESGAVITLLGDTTGSGVKINKGITIDFGGYTYTANSAVGSKGTESQAFQILYGANKANPCNVTLKNGKIAVTEGVNLKVVIMNYSNLTLENMTLDGTGSSVMMYGMSTNNGASALTGNTSIKVADGVVALDVDGSQKSYGKVDIEINTTGTIEGKVDIYGDELAVEVLDGTFTDIEDVKAYLADGDMLVEQGDGTYVVGEKADWTTATDSGYYTDGDTDFGMMRFLFKNNTDKEVTEVGIKYIYTSETEKNSLSAGKEFKVVTDKKAFYGDVASIPQGTNGTYYAVGYAVLENGSTVWSDIVECSVDWNRYFKDYVGGAN